MCIIIWKKYILGRIILFISYKKKRLLNQSTRNVVKVCQIIINWDKILNPLKVYIILHKYTHTHKVRYPLAFSKVTLIHFWVTQNYRRQSKSKSWWFCSCSVQNKRIWGDSPRVRQSIGVRQNGLVWVSKLGKR